VGVDGVRIWRGCRGKKIDVDRSFAPRKSQESGGGVLADGPGDHNHGPVASCSLGFASDSASNMGPASLNRHMGFLAKQNHFLCTVHDKLTNEQSRTVHLRFFFRKNTVQVIELESQSTVVSS
jgi:hypothetical protein